MEKPVQGPQHLGETLAFGDLLVGEAVVMVWAGVTARVEHGVELLADLPVLVERKGIDGHEPGRRRVDPGGMDGHGDEGERHVDGRPSCGVAVVWVGAGDRGHCSESRASTAEALLVVPVGGSGEAFSAECRMYIEEWVTCQRQ